MSEAPINRVLTNITHLPLAEFQDMQIYRLKPNNPRQAGSRGWRSWETYHNGMIVRDYIALGGDRAGPRRRHLRWDLVHGSVELRDV
jgi:hypothetical protein